jgi:hypothetical protein
MADGVDADNRAIGAAGKPTHRMVPGSLVTVTLLIPLLGEGWLG